MTVIILFLTLVMLISVKTKPLHDDMEDEVSVNQKSQPEGVVFGDIKLTKEQEQHYAQTRQRRAIGSLERYKWPHGIVNVKISSAFDSVATAFIISHMLNIERKSCVRFNIVDDVTTVKDYVHIVAGSGCWSFVGRIGNKQQLSLSRFGCLNERIPTHELLHALGFHHEQARPDRDQYVEILYDNIQDGKSRNFDKYHYINSFGELYDYLSVMHYREYAFTKNGMKTIRALNSIYNGRLGGSVMTDSDIRQLNLLYGCYPTTTTHPTTAPIDMTSTTTTESKSTTKAAKSTSKTTTIDKTTTSEPSTTTTAETKSTTEAAKTTSKTTTVDMTTISTSSSTTTAESKSTTEAAKSTSKTTTIDKTTNSKPSSTTTAQFKSTTGAVKTTGLTTTFEMTTNSKPSSTTTTESKSTTEAAKTTIPSCVDTKDWCFHHLVSYCTNSVFRKECGCVCQNV